VGTFNGKSITYGTLWDNTGLFGFSTRDYCILTKSDKTFNLIGDFCIMLDFYGLIKYFWVVSYLIPTFTFCIFSTFILIVIVTVF